MDLHRWTGRAAATLATLLAALWLWQASPDTSVEARSALRDACQDAVYAQMPRMTSPSATMEAQRMLTACRSVRPGWDVPLLRDAMIAGAFAAVVVLLLGMLPRRH